MPTFKESADYERRINTVRSDVLGMFAHVEDEIDVALAASHARDVPSFWNLYLDVFPRTQVPVRIELFKRLVEEAPAPPGPGHGSARTFLEAHPLMLPILDEVVRARNVLAHAIVDRTSEDYGKIKLRQRRKGKIETITFALDHLEGLLKHELPLLRSMGEFLLVVADIELVGTLSGYDEGIEDDGSENPVGQRGPEERDGVPTD